MAVAPSLEWLREHAKRKAAQHQLAECQYIAVRNPTAKDGLWRIKERRQVIYVRLDLPSEQRIDIAAAHRDRLAT
jgi:hypothetical protein